MRAARGRVGPEGLAEDGADVRVQVEAGRVGRRQPHHRRLAGVILLDQGDGHRQVGDEDQVPAPERHALARPLGLLVLDQAEHQRVGQHRQVEAELPQQLPGRRAVLQPGPP
ncbi:hypothetical protein ACFVSN_44230 [Kitasatospora sp. NPDC057904]|uniref:hypothetical protein n=1 Tax=Kitasatospora sp. NPDC057904 TaxID=3346275 RepID=UPI0036DC0DCB